MEEENKKKEVDSKKINLITMRIPQCCIEGWASCPHVAKKSRPSKRNVGL